MDGLPFARSVMRKSSSSRGIGFTPAPAMNRWLNLKKLSQRTRKFVPFTSGPSSAGRPRLPTGSSGPGTRMRTDGCSRMPGRSCLVGAPSVKRETRQCGTAQSAVRRSRSGKHVNRPLKSLSKPNRTRTRPGVNEEYQGGRNLGSLRSPVTVSKVNWR